MRFLAIEHELPTRVVTNDDVVAGVRAASAPHLSLPELDDLEELLRDLFASAGTTVRYHRADGEDPTDLATRAGKRALAAAGLDPADVDLVLYVGIGRGILEPASATIYQDLLGLVNATAFDVLDACASWARALQMAKLYLDSGTYRNVLILNAEFGGSLAHRYELRTLAEFAHWHPGVTIGEAATATIVSRSDPDDFEASFRTFGRKRDLCFVPLPEVRGYLGKEVNPEGGLNSLQFYSFGLRLMEFGTRKLIEHYQDMPRYEEFGADVVFTHSASDGMSEHVVEKCGIDPVTFLPGHRHWANTVSASVPLSMSHALREGSLRDGDKVLLLIASAGVSTALVKFTYTT